MAAIIRVKRKRDHDPAEALLLACKKRREGEDNTEAVKSSEITEVLKFAGTILTRDASLSTKIRDAIRKEKLQKEYKKHDIDIPVKARQSAFKSSGKNRYQVITSRRAINLDHLDENKNDEIDTNISSGKSAGNQADTYKDPCKDSSTKTDGETDKSILQKRKRDTDQQVLSSKVFCLYDVENLELNSTTPSQPSPGRDDDLSQVTCNSVPMVRERVEKPVDSTNTADYVYDLYYTNRAGLDFRALETVLRIEAYGEDCVYGNNSDVEDDQVYEDEDDSNDEGNWRNDYPDEDPLYYENAEEGFLYEEDMNPSHLLMENGQRMEDYMASHLTIGADELSSEDEVDPYALEQRSYQKYLKDINKDMK